MTPSPQELSDEALDQLIEAARPSLRHMLRSTIKNEVPIHMVEIAKVPLPSGQQWSVTLAVMNEPFSVLAACTLMQGVPGMRAAFDKLNAKPETADPPPGFEIPV